MIDGNWNIPEWAQAERMEMIVPMDELHRYGDGKSAGRSVHDGIVRIKDTVTKLFSNIKKRKKRFIFVED